MVMILMKMMILIKAMMMKRLKLYTLEVEKLNERKTEMSKIRFNKSLKVVSMRRNKSMVGEF